MIIEATGEDYASLLRGLAPRHYRLADTPIAPPEILQMLADLAARIGEAFAPASWLIVEEGELVGLCSVKAVNGDVIDIGYGIAPSRWNRGIAGRAIGKVVTWAHSAPGIAAITAETTPDNFASQRLLKRNGFRQIGKRVDEEDGPVLCWRCTTS